ncbi:MAG: hypothetical protein HLUCCX14_07525 [Marinobacter excellens HL-55]|uniref:Uncharacterized protein n=1 Tax=Marinobacter excellens HL-55 TaxID=1305731 RepID=A0A0P7YF63_9GAMM|nr:MAG: hypothetical protein HLUCCX14_07525 [Marinobacter excellens HL-55]
MIFDSKRCRIKLLTLIFLLFVLAGCGGGGGGSDAPPEPDVTTDGDRTTSPPPSNEPAPGPDEPDSIASAVVAQAERTLAERDTLLELQQPLALYRFLADYAYLTGLQTFNEREQQLAPFAPENQATHPVLDRALVNLDANLRLYRIGELTLPLLQQALDNAEQAIENHGDYAKRLLQTQQDLLTTLGLPADLVATLGPMAYSPDGGYYSFFVTDSRFGEWQAGEFLLKEAFMALNGLVRVRATQNLLCEVF